jgi:hypothetical protein
MRAGRIGALALLFVAGNVSGAQGTEAGSRSRILGVTASGFIGPYPNENIPALGGIAGVEQKLSEGISLRALASLQRAFSSRNEGICRPDGLDGCLTILFPYWLSSVEVDAVVRPIPGFPVRLVGGVGYAIGSDARGNRSGARRTSLPSEMGIVIRRGIEVALSRSSRAPRLQYTHSEVRPQPFALNRVEAVTLLFVR